MSRRPVDSWAGAAIGTVHGARAVKNDVYLDNSLDSGVDGMRDSPNNSAEDLPDYITDAPNNITYLRGKFLGKGGFARVHEMKDLTTNTVFAGKIIPKSRITKPHHQEKINREIDVHRSLSHQHVVGFHGCFEDMDNVYIVLENCPRKSLVHVLKHRKTLTEPEVRYYMWQLIEGVKYIHSKNIIHRDLKLGNMFLTEEMVMKIGDFGLAARADPTSPSKATICGTPNYIAPEVLGKMGHSYQADIWAIGCIMYAMLVGQPPFETATLKETYFRITMNKYCLPLTLSTEARNLIARLLHPVPTSRPSLNQVLNDEFFNAYIPPVLPTSCCVEAPKFKMSSAMLTRSRPERMDASCGRTEENKCIVSSMSTLNIALESSPKAVPVSMDVTPSEVSAPTKRTALVRRETSAADSTPESRLSRSQSLKDNLQCLSKRETKMATRSRTKLATAVSNEKLTMGTVSQSNPSSGYESTSTSSSSQCQSNPQSSDQGPVTGNACKTPMFNHVVVVTLRMQESIKQCLRVMPADVCCNPSPRKGPQPVFISKWIDYSNKYGFGFQLSDKSVGVMFNDNTRIACSGDRRRVEFWDSEGGLSIFNQGNVPQPLEERYTLLRYFAKYMDENLTEGGGHGAPARADVPMATNGAMNGSSCVSTIPHMRCWIRSSAAIIMHLSDGTVQINFFKDHTKVVISATDDAEDFVPRPTVLITFINSQRSSSTYDIASLTLRGCEPILRERLVFASSALEQITPLKEKQV